MFELFSAKAGAVLKSTRFIGRQIYREIKKQRRSHHIEKIEHYLNKEAVDEQSGIIEEVDEDMLNAIKQLEKADEGTLKIEKNLTLYLYRFLPMIKKDAHRFDEVNQKLQGIIGDAAEGEMLREITEFFKREHEAIHKELLRVARIFRDQHENYARLRDEILINVMAEMRDIHRARRLRRIFKKEKRLGKDEKATIEQLQKLLSARGTPDEIKKAIRHIKKDIKNENSVVHELLTSIEFITKMAVKLFFNLKDEEGKIKKVSQHLQEMEFPPSYLQRWAGELQKLDEWINKATEDTEHIGYQILHSKG